MIPTNSTKPATMRAFFMENEMTKKITGDMCVAAVRDAGKIVTAKEIAAIIGNTDSRAVGTALRKPVNDGRVKAVYNRENHEAKGVWSYRFVRLIAKKGGAA